MMDDILLPLFELFVLVFQNHDGVSRIGSTPIPVIKSRCWSRMRGLVSASAINFDEFANEMILDIDCALH